MRLFKLISLAFVLSILGGYLLTSVAQAQEDTNANELDSALVEFEQDEIDAIELGIEEPSVLPGEGGYWWQKTKENIGLFFTFDSEEKAKKLEEIANRRLLEAKELAEQGNENAANKIEEALERYQERMEELGDRLADNPELKAKLLEQFDANQLKHQQVLSSVVEKLRARASDEQLEKLEEIKKQNALNWHNVEPNQIKERLEKAVENNDVGSKFKQLRNVATLEEIEETLPVEAQESVEAAISKARLELSNRLKNADVADAEKIEKYISNIEVSDVVKQKFVDNMKDAENIPRVVKTTAAQLSNSYAQQMKEKFDSLDEAGQKRFLEQFDTRSHPAYLEFLENIDVPTELLQRVQELKESQQEGIRLKIQNTTDPVKLRSLENNLRANPVLRKEIQVQQRRTIQAPAATTNISQ